MNLRINERLIPSLVMEIIAVINGATVIRTHNVKETSVALRDFTIGKLVFVILNCFLGHENKICSILKLRLIKDESKAKLIILP